MKKLIRITLIVTATLLACNGHAAEQASIVDEVWKNAPKGKESLKAQEIFNRDVKNIDNTEKSLTKDQIRKLTLAIVKIIPKMSILGMGGMDAKNQELIKQALKVLEKGNSHEIIVVGPEKMSGKLTPLPSDKSLTKQIKEKLSSLLKNEEKRIEEEAMRENEEIERDFEEVYPNYKNMDDIIFP